MNAVLMTEWRGTEADYDRTLERVQREVEPDSHCICHAMAVTGENRFSVVEVWTDRAAMESWFDKAKPVIMAELGDQQEQLSWNVYDLHNLMTNQPEHSRLQDA